MVANEKRPPDYGMIRLFVYGTLKQGHYNNVVLKRSGGKFLGYDKIVLDNAAFVSLGFCPACVYPITAAGNDTQAICGEIWYGNQEMIKSCDILEGHPEFFRRSKQWSTIHERRCWMYSLEESWLSEATDFLDKSIWEPKKQEREFWNTHND